MEVGTSICYHLPKVVHTSNLWQDGYSLQLLYNGTLLKDRHDENVSGEWSNHTLLGYVKIYRT